VQRRHREAPKIYRLTEANKNTAIEHGLYSTIRAMHNVYQPEKKPLHNSFELRPGLCIYIMKKTAIRNKSRIATEFSAE